MDNNVTALLRSLRSSTPGCVAIALADLDTDMVLTQDPENGIEQEVWDALALKAADLLTGNRVESVLVMCGASKDDFIRWATLRRGSDMFVVMRSRAEPPLGLLLACDEKAQPDLFVQSAIRDLEALATIN